MALPAGTRLGPYELTAPLGAGGMGEVYRARDTRLDRAVAVKVLPTDVSQDEDRRRRFEREARAIAALNHPHICTVHDVGDDGGVAYLVMELIEGRTLADRLQSGRLEIPEAVTYATQIADALATAHRHGIVHRDLKPGNIMLTRSGSGSGGGLPQAKLLDFGLARVQVEPAVADAATATGPLTGPGRILGTLNYMAPEQLEGRPHDARADVFAFGAILFEMITGTRAFDGATPASVVGAVLHTAPPAISAIIPGAPPALERLIAGCLAKNPDERWSTANDVRLQLRAGAIDERAASAVAAPDRSRREWLAWAVAAALAAVAVAAATLPRRGPDQPVRGVERFSILPPAGAATSHSWEAPQVSPDGRQIAFAAGDAAGTVRLYVRDRSELEARVLAGTEDATLPFWSPDSTMLGFFAGAQLKTVAVAGGAPRTLAPAPVARGGTWGTDGRILFTAVPNAPPQLVPAAGGTVTSVPAEAEERGFRLFPWLLPDGRHYVFMKLEPASGGPIGVRVASIDSIEVKDVVAGAKGNAIYVNGWLLYLRDATLVGQRLNLSTLEVEGNAVALAEDVGFNGITYQALFSASGDALAYLGTPRGAQLSWFDRQGRALGAATPPGDFSVICLSADERQVIYDQTDPLTGAVDLWRIDLGTHQPTRLTFNAAVDFYPTCGPAGPTAGDVIFSSLRLGPPSLFRLPIGVPGSEQLVLESPTAKIASQWSPDGRLIVYSVLNQNTNWDVATWPIAGGEPRMIVATAADERSGRVSPDGRWLAYSASEQRGRFDIYVQPFPQGGAKWQVSRGGGSQPQWSHDGRELFYMSSDRKLTAVAVTPGATGFAPGEPRTLVNTPSIGRDGPNIIASQYAVTADGQRFLISVASSDAAPITLMLNWTPATPR